MSGVWVKTHLAAYRRNNDWFRYETHVGGMKPDTARTAHSAAVSLPGTWRTVKHPIFWALVLSTGLHAALFSGADQLRPSVPIPIPLPLTADLQATITIEDQVIGSQITRAAAASHSKSLEPALSAMQSHYKQLRKAVDRQSQEIAVMKQHSQLQAGRIENLQQERVTMARDNLGLRLEITRRTQSQEALQAQHKELTLLYKTSLAQNTRLHQTSDQQQQLHKLQVDENQKLKNQTLSQACLLYTSPSPRD